MEVGETHAGVVMTLSSRTTFQGSQPLQLDFLPSLQIYKGTSCQWESFLALSESVSFTELLLSSSSLGNHMELETACSSRTESVGRIDVAQAFPFSGNLVGLPKMDLKF